MSKTKRQVAILGTATSTVEQAPAAGGDWEVWVCSSWFEGKIEAYDRFYEVHSRRAIEMEGCDTFLQWLREKEKPVYVTDDLGLPNQVMLPRKDIEARVPGRGFYTSTISLMLAHALYEHQVEKKLIDKIGIWGVDMSTDHEYGHQKAGCLHFMAVAQMVGIELVLPIGSELHKVPPSYPNDSPAHLEVTRLLEGVEATKKKVEEAQRLLHDDLTRADAQIAALRMLLRTVV